MSYEQLLKKISPTLKRISYKLNKQVSFCSADDLYQEALIHLWLDFSAGKLADKTDSYILQGCYFYLKNHIRKNNDKVRLISIDPMDSEREDTARIDEIRYLSSADSTFEDTYCKMLIEQINNNGLTIREKQVFNFALKGLTVREIGGRLGISHVRVVKLRRSIAEKCLKHIDKI
ncbi:MAG: sigma-70 family RNA polymerase sigma factor [Candidatus Omnitrophota bacterium]|jgi:RNA polymerase sigma factor (sigma-70 family)